MCVKSLDGKIGGRICSEVGDLIMKESLQVESTLEEFRKKDVNLDE
jgi:hypothetical protein